MYWRQVVCNCKIYVLNAEILLDLFILLELNFALSMKVTYKVLGCCAQFPLRKKKYGGLGFGYEIVKYEYWVWRFYYIS